MRSAATAALTAAWAVTVVGLRWHSRPLPRRRGQDLWRTSARPLSPRTPDAAVRALDALGRRTARMLPQAVAGAVPPVRIGTMALALLVAGLLAGPVAALVAGTGASAVAVARARDRVRRRTAALVDDVPEVVDLLVVAIAAGLTVRHALDAVVAVAPGPFARELERALDDVLHGVRLADALEVVPARTSEIGRHVVTSLVDAERYGTPVLSTLEVAAADARADRRRRAETAARRLPVLLLFPLVTCILPAFALLTVTPMLAGGLPSLGL